MKKKSRKNKDINQSSFYFEDYLETNKKNKILKATIFKIGYIYYFFFLFFFNIDFSIKITHVSLNKKIFT